MAVDDWRITMMLADAAQVSDGKLFVLGGGWQFIGSPQSPYAVAIIVAVPWTETNKKHRLSVALHDSDGNPVRIATQTSGADAQAVSFAAEFEIGRPPGFKPGTPLNVPLAFGVGPLGMPAGRYEWSCTIDDGAPRDDWKLAFDIRS